MSICSCSESAERMLLKIKKGEENPKPSKTMELDRRIYHELTVLEQQTGKTWTGGYVCQAISFTMHELILVSCEYKRGLHKATDKKKLALRCKFCDLLKALISLLGALEFSVEDIV